MMHELIIRNLCCMFLLLHQSCYALVHLKPSGASPLTNGNDGPARNSMDKNSIYSYASYWENLLLEEYQQNVEELKQRRKTWSRARLEASGMSIFHAAAEPDSEVYGEKIVRVFKGGGESLGKGVSWKDRLARGDVLVMTPTPSSRTQTFERIRKDPVVTPRECLVIDVGDDWITVGVGPTWPSGLWETRKDPGAFVVRLDRTAPRAPLKAQRSALDRLKRGKAGDAAMLMAHIFNDDQIRDAQKDVNLELTAQLPPRFISSNPDDSMSPSIARVELREQIWRAIQNATEGITFQPNQSQKDAIAWALQRRLSLIRGPPGTGKTRVAALLISSALQLKGTSSDEHRINNNSTDSDTTSDDYNGQEQVDQRTSPPRVLAVTHSNGAADVLLEALLQMSVPAVRLGRPASVSPSVQHRTVDAIAEKIPQVLKLRQKAGDATLDRQERTAAAFDLKRYITDVKEIITKTAPVIVTSCIGAHQLLVDSSGSEAEISNFPLVVLDEAAQTTEPALMCALSAARAQQLVLVGDTKQLPPTITSVDLRHSLGISPMARLEKSGIGEVTLAQQYRMPPSLLEHPSEYFYDGKVICADQKRTEAPPPKGFPWPMPNIPLAFVNVGDDSEIAHNFGGRTNPTEVDMVVGIVTKLLESGDTSAEKIAVISPYSKQVQLIRAELSNLKIKTKNSQQGRIRVGTVDSFQGYETDIIIFSAVRSNQVNELGFLRDSRRLCVAITRARRALILVGDQKVLRSCRHWARLIDSCTERQCMVDAAEFVDKEELRLLSEAKSNSESKTKDDAALNDTDNSLHGLIDGEDDGLYGLFG